MTIEFDDLIPSNKTSIEFDDLIPKGDQKASGHPGWMPDVTPGRVSVLQDVPPVKPFDFKASSMVSRILDDQQERMQKHGTIGALVGPKPSVNSITTGLLSDLVSGGKAARAGVNQMAGDLTGSQYLLGQARKERGQADLMTAMNTPAFESDTAQGIYGGVSSTVRQLPSLAAAIATRNPNIALGGMVAPMLPDEYGKFRQRGGSPLESLAGAAGSTATEYLTEKMPMGFLVKGMGRMGAGQFLTGLLAREVPGEQVATLVQDAIDTAVANPDKTWGDYLAERPGAAYQTLLATATQAGIMGGANAISNRLSSPAQQPAPNTEVNQQAVARLFGSAPATPGPLPTAPITPTITPSAPPAQDVVNRILQAIEQTQAPQAAPAMEAQAPAEAAAQPPSVDALTFDDLVPSAPEANLTADDQVTQPAQPMLPVAEDSSVVDPDLVAQLQKDFEALVQGDLKTEIKDRLGLTPKAAAPEPRTRQSPLRAFLREVGIDPALASDIVGERGIRANNRLPATFRKGGLQLDALVERAVERGFITPQEVQSTRDNGGTNRLVEMIQAELRGEQQQTSELADETNQRLMQDNASAELEQRAGAIGFKTDGLTDDQVASALSRIDRRRARAQARSDARWDAQQQMALERQAIADDELMDARIEAALTGPSNMTTEDAMRALGFTDQEIQDAANRPQTTGEDSANGEANNGNAAARAPGVSGNDQGSAGGQPEGLQSYTREEVIQRQDQQAQQQASTQAEEAAAQADAKAKSERKDIAQRQDASAENFQLGQSAEDSLAGQGGLFDAPLKASKPAAEMSVQELLRAAADKMDSEQKQAPAPADKGLADAENVAPRADDAGNVAMFSRTNTKSGIEPTITIDGKERPTTNSNGQPIAATEEAIRNFYAWFGDSKVVDDQGRPLVVYHGSPDATFDVFNPEQYFSEIGDIASIYTNTSASSIASKSKKGEAPAVYPVYLKISNPFDTRVPKNRRIFEREFYNKYGTGTPLSGKGLPDWNDALDLAEWINEESKGFDGLILDEGGLPQNDGSVKSRGISFVSMSGGTQIKSATGNNGDFSAANPDIRYRKGASATGLLVTQVQQVTDTIRARWANAPKIVVITDMQDAQVPEAVRKEDAAQKRNGANGEPKGFFHDGKVYLVASQLESNRDVIETLFHEALGHAGLRGVFGAELDKILDEVASTRRTDIVAKAREYGLVRNANGKPSVDVKTATNAEVWAAMDLTHKRQAAEEVLAVMSQGKPELGLVKSAVAAIRAWLRKHVPGFADMKMTDAELINSFILPARNFVERGAGGAGGVTAFQRGTNEAMTNNDVVGNQGGRSADDSTPGAAKKKSLLTKSEFDAAVEFVKTVEALAEKHGAIYVRWSASEDHDLSEGAKSRDYGSGEIHGGLSSQKIDADMHPVTIARRIAEYGFTRLGKNDTYPRIYTANEVGTDSDNAVSITNLKKVIDIPKSFVVALDKKFHDAYDYQDSIATWTKRGSAPELVEKYTRFFNALVQPNESPAPNSDVVGNQGGRSADDSTPGPSSLADVVKSWDAAGIKSTISESKGAIELSRIVAPDRSQGIGTRAMEQLSAYADKTGQRILLTPSSDFGGSKSRLESFYKRFGFVKNSGRSRDFSTRHTMIREPVKRESPALKPEVDENTGLPLNADGTVTLYHHTSSANAKAIRQTGTLKAKAEPDVYVTTRRETDTGYGDTAVAIRVNPDKLTIDDEFPDGRKDFRMNVGKPGGSIKVQVENESTAPNSDGAPMFSRTGSQPTPAKQSPNRDALGRVKFRLGEVAFAKLDAASKPLLTMFGMRMASPELRRQLRQMKATIENAKLKAVDVAKQMNAMPEVDRVMVSDIVEKLIAPGVVPPAYAVQVADAITKTMDQQTDELVALGMLSKDSADRWRGRYLPRLYNRKTELGDDPLVQRLFKTGRPAMQGMGGGSLKGRGLFQDVSVDSAEQWLAMGYEVRDPHWTMKQGKLALIDPNTPKVAREQVTVWRDWTPSERAQMGESRDALARFVSGYTSMQGDIALGRLFANIANNPEWVRKSGSDGWVKAPDTEIADTGGVKRYGNLAGLYVSPEVMSHLSKFEEAADDALQLYRGALGIWKAGKTALNPVAHFNNVMGNLSMAHFAGVSYWDGHKYAGTVRDFMKGSPMLEEAQAVGLFTGSFTKEELIKAMPPELQKLMDMEDGKARKAGRQIMNAMTFWLRQPLQNAYEFEDSFFKYLIYRDARQQGMAPEEAMDYALRYIFTYDDLPSGARKVRDFAIPFFSWTYKAVPALLHTAMVYPWRFLAPAAVLHGIGLVGYAMAAGDEDDDWLEKIAKGRELEKEEREALPERMAGMGLLLNPKTIRLGTDSLTGNPIFLDASRVVPGGDMFDMVNQAGGLPIPPPLMPNHPILTTFSAMIANKEMFMGREVTDKNDTAGEAAEKRAKWMAGMLLPAVSPGGYHSQRIADAAANAMDTVIETPLGDFTGVDRSGLPVQPKYAAMQTLGIKARPVDLELEAQRKKAQESAVVNSIAAEVRSMARLHQKGAASDRMMESTRETAREKIERLRDE